MSDEFQVADATRAIEGILMVAIEPVPVEVIAQLLEIPVATVDTIVESLQSFYDESHRGFQLVRVAGGLRFQSHPDVSPYVERFVLDGQRARLSAAALETLAIIAYKQPISRLQIASIRGVDPDAVLRTLQGRGYVEQRGRDDGPGQAVLWGRPRSFWKSSASTPLTSCRRWPNSCPMPRSSRRSRQPCASHPSNPMGPVPTVPRPATDDERRR